MLDRLPPAARHAVLLLVINPLVAAAGVATSAVLAVAGIDGIDWPAVVHSASSAGAVVMASGLATWIGCWVTPITRQYGAGAQR